MVFPGSFGVNIIEHLVSANILSVGYDSLNWEASSYSDLMGRLKYSCEDVN